MPTAIRYPRHDELVDPMQLSARAVDAERALQRSTRAELLASSARREA